MRKTLKKTLTIFGTRPEAIKLAPVVLEMQRRRNAFDVSVCVTGQHREMLDQVLTLFDIKPDYDLDIMSPGQTLGQVTARAMEGLDRVISAAQPDVILVQGDTTTAFCGALTAYYHQITVGHVEAGLRTGNKYAPFPEEVNRCLVGSIADLHFAPTERAKETLLKEGKASSDVFLTGNTVIDALLWVRELVRADAPEFPEDVLKAISGRQMVLVTGHRRESFGDGFDNICHAIRDARGSVSRSGRWRRGGGDRWRRGRGTGRGGLGGGPQSTPWESCRSRAPRSVTPRSPTVWGAPSR